MTDTEIKIFKESLPIRLPQFIATRALICANSGGGKSYAVRKLLEETHGKVMAIVLDVEGEFKTLREKFDFLLIGEGGDVSLSLKAAPLLPKKLLELNVSTIIDISELKHGERIQYVKKFLDSLMETPRELWKPCIVVLDEAHILAGQQEKQDSTFAVIDLMTRGRKRGFCGILCTQRISKLHKDAVAEANNIMIGRTGLDIDMKRAAEILGFTNKQDMLSLRDLDPGEFYVFGPAISKTVSKAKVGEVKTLHPRVGMDIRKDIVPPTDKIKAILSKLSELPKEAEQEMKDLQDYKRKIKELQGQMRLMETKQIVKADEQQLKRATEHGIREAKIVYEKQIIELQREIRTYERKLQEVGRIVGTEVKHKEMVVPIISPKIVPVQVARPIQKVQEELVLGAPMPLRSGAMRMLNWLAGVYPQSLTKQRIAVLSGFSAEGGTFGAYISDLKSNGWIQGNKEFIITQEGLNNSSPEDIPKGEDLLIMWKGKFRAGAGKILQFIYDNYPNSVSAEEIGDATHFEPSGGTFGAYISELKRTGLIVEEDGGFKASEEFFV